MNGIRASAAALAYGRLITWLRSPLNVATVLLIAALWLSSRRYMGVVADGELYAFQALNNLMPGRFSDDLYFKYGSQDSFTVFSYVFRPLVAYLGLPVAEVVGVLAGSALWLAGLVAFLTAAINTPRQRVLAALGVVALNAHYGGLMIFSYGEAFVTPRLYAEAFLLFALACALRRRFLVAAATAVAAAALHPLIALPGIAALAFYYAFKDRRIWFVIVAVLVAGIGLAATHVDPFSRFLQTFDTTWLSIVIERCDFAFLSRWSPGEWLQVAAVVAIALSGLGRLSPDPRRLVFAVIIAGGAGILATAIGADLLANVLIVNLQPWRALWLLTLVANGLLPLVIANRPVGSASFDILCAAFAANLASDLLWVPTYVPATLSLIGCGAIVVERAGFIRWIGPIGFCLRLVSVFLIVWAAGLIIWEVRYYERFGIYLASTLFIAAIAAVILLLTRVKRSWTPLVVAIPAFLIAVAVYDNRSPWQRFLESNESNQALAAMVKGDRNIYWENGLDILWFKLERPSYYSCSQGTGVMFYRETAIDYHRRQEGLMPLRNADVAGHSIYDSCHVNGEPSLGPATIDALRDVCGRLKDLDAVVLTQRISGVPARTFVLPTPMKLRSGSVGRFKYPKELYAYACSSVR